MAAKKKSSSKKKTSYQLLSPLNGEVLGTYKREQEPAVLKRFATQRAPAAAFGQTSVAERRVLLKKIRKEFIKEVESFVDRAQKETGKPEAEVYGGEIVANIELFDFYIKHMGKLLKPERAEINPINYPGKKGYIHHQSLGIVGVISSWNYPVALALRAIIPAIAAGNGVAFKPSDQSTLSGELIAEIFQRHLPRGVMEVYYGGREAIGALTEVCHKINFIGAVSTGKVIAARCGERLIPCSTELSGKDAAIVLADADIDRAINGVIWGAFTNSGQNCASIERLFVHKAIADTFIPELVKRVERLRLQIDIGPLRNENQVKAVESHLGEVKRKGGGKILTGGSRVKGTLFFEPTVIKVTNYKLTLMHDETFGPTLPIYVINDLDEGLTLANDCEYGLTASIWTKDIDAAEERARELQVGVAMINNSVFTGALASAPWGGVKHTGHGVTNSKYGLLEMTRPMFVLTDRSKKPKEPWWYPYTPELTDMLKAATKLASGKVLSVLSFSPSWEKF